MYKLRKEEKEKKVSLFSPSILYEDENLLVFDKPSGWVVNDADSTHDRDTVQKWVSKNGTFELAKNFEKRSGIVHRLDKETSGCIIIAKDVSSFENLQHQFAERTVTKTYTALVHGRVKLESGEIDAPLGRLPWKRNKFGVLKSGRVAQTSYKLIQRLKNKNEEFTLLSLFPKTGRTHQIRVHLKHLGHSIVSDPLYAGRKTLRRDKEFCERLFLHAGRTDVEKS